MNGFKIGIILMTLFTTLSALSCAPVSSKPVVSIGSPTQGAQVDVGQEVLVQASAADVNGVARIELWVDAQLLSTATSPSLQSAQAAVLRWTPTTAGPHLLVVYAINARNSSSEPASVTVNAIAKNGSAEPPAAPTQVPPKAGACVNGAAFVTHVTAPDETPWKPGQTFNKIWRVRNSGTCAWGSGYQLVLQGGEAMTAPAAVAVPATAPGSTADLLVAMVAPAVPGTHMGVWQLRSANGEPFGPAMSSGDIKVLGSAGPPPTQPPQPTAQPPANSCPGAPVIASFSANPAAITAGQSTTLSWGKVDNATSAVIDQGIGGVAAPGNASVKPDTTTTYTLTATGCGGTVTKQATITVSSASITFDYSPKAVAPGNYVTLTFSAPVPTCAIRLGNTVMAKMLGTADYKEWKVLIPGPAVSDYLYVDYDGKTVKSAQPLTVTPPPPPKVGDLAVTKIGPVSTTRADKVYVDIKNTGTGDLNNANVHVVCQAMGRMRGNPAQQIPTASDEWIKITLSAGGTGFFWPSLIINVPAYSYDFVTCVAGLDGDPTPNDNTTTISIP